MTVPMSVAGFERIADDELRRPRRRDRAAKASAMGSSTMIRLTAVQRCPEFLKAP